jgi:MFS family permease
VIARIRRAYLVVPATVRLLTGVSLANDAASEMLYPVLPLFLTTVLHAPVAALGVVEGVAEAVAVVFRGIVGPISDRRGGRRRPYISGGYAASVVGRLLVAIAPAWGLVLVARVVDRFGKAVRTPPRDALIRDASPPETVGASFGFHRMGDSTGAVIGPLVAAALLAGGASLRAVIVVAIVPGVLTLLLLRRLHDPPREPQPALPKAHHVARELPRRFWIVLGGWCLFVAGNSSDAFLLLRANDLGLSLTASVLAYALFSAVYAGCSWPFGSLSDRIGRRHLLVGGLVAFAIVYGGLALADEAWAVWPLFAAYGLYLAATDGVGKAFVADYAPKELSGTAYGVLSAVTGALALFASVVAGVLWQTVSPSAPFALGAIMAIAGAIVIALSGRA